MYKSRKAAMKHEKSESKKEMMMEYGKKAAMKKMAKKAPVKKMAKKAKKK